MTAGGILLPDAAREKPQQGRVLSVGDGRMLSSGSRAPHQVSEGDRVLFQRRAGGSRDQRARPADPQGGRVPRDRQVTAAELPCVASFTRRRCRSHLGPAGHRRRRPGPLPVAAGPATEHAFGGGHQVVTVGAVELARRGRRRSRDSAHRPTSRRPNCASGPAAGACRLVPLIGTGARGIGHDEPAARCLELAPTQNAGLVATPGVV